MIHLNHDEAQLRQGRLVGTQRRSGKIYDRARQLIQEGGIGKVTVCRAYHRSNMSPEGIGHAPVTEPPPELDWDMWLGPRPMRPFQATIAPYKYPRAVVSTAALRKTQTGKIQRFRLRSAS